MGRGGAEGGLAIPPDPGLKPEHLLTGAPKFYLLGAPRLSISNDGIGLNALGL